MFEYTPGTRASDTLGGSGSSQRSGRQVVASGPQMAGSRLTPMMLHITSVLRGMKTSEIGCPLSPVMGVPSGSITSLRALGRNTAD